MIERKSSAIQDFITYTDGVAEMAKGLLMSLPLFSVRVDAFLLKWTPKGFSSLESQKWKCQTLQQYLALRTAHCMNSPGPKGCRNQVLPRPDWLLEGWVGFTARLVFTSPFLSSMVGMTTTGMRVHCSSVPSEDITSVYPSSQLHVLVCREQVVYTV